MGMRRLVAEGGYGRPVREIILLLHTRRRLALIGAEGAFLADGKLLTGDGRMGKTSVFRRRSDPAMVKAGTDGLSCRTRGGLRYWL